MKIKSSITQFNIDRITSKTGNIYKSVKIIGKRARQLSTVQKEELNEKLAEFASDIDNLEEIFHLVLLSEQQKVVLLSFLLF